MKRLLAVCACLVITVLGAAAAAPGPAAALVSTGDGSWLWRAPQLQGNWLLAGCSIGGDTWAVGQGGTILKSGDGGVTWTPQSSGTSQSLNDVLFVDAMNGWAVGGADADEDLFSGAVTRVILHTSDGGATWVTQAVAGDTVLNGVYFVDSLKGWAAGSHGTMAYTVNGGASWRYQLTGTHASLTSVHFIDAQKGWAGGPGGAMLRTSNGGMTWRTSRLGAWAHGLRLIKPSIAPDGSGVAIMCDPGNFWQAGSGRMLAATDDGGWSWHRLISRRHREFTAVCATGGGQLFAAAVIDATAAFGDALVYLRSVDGGQSWSHQIVNALLPDDIVAGPAGLCAIGYGMVMTSADGDRWLPRSSWGYTPSWFEMFDAGHGIGLTQVWANDGSLPGGETMRLVTLDDGVNWKPGPALPPGITARAADFLDAQHGWVIGLREGAGASPLETVLLATTDGGATWQEEMSEPGFGWNITFSDELHGWACGYDLGENGDGYVLRTTDGGQSWQRADLPAGFYAFAVDFVGLDEGWAVGMGDDGRSIAHTSDGGIHWELQASPADGLVPMLMSVTFVDAEHGWATGLLWGADTPGVLLATDDGGATWTRQGQAAGIDDTVLNGVTFLDTIHGWAYAGFADSGGMPAGTWRTDDGGVTWDEQLSGVGDGLYCVAVAEGQAFAASPYSGFLGTSDLSGDTAPPTTYDDFDGRYQRQPVTIHLTAADIGGGSVASTDYSVDEAGWQAYAGAIDLPAPADHSNDGFHRVQYHSTDTNGNTEASYAVTVPIDTQGPSTTVPRPAKCRRGGRVGLRFAVTDAVSRRADVRLKVRRAGDSRVFKTLCPGWVRTGKTHTFGWVCPLRPGHYMVTVYARDQAGNQQAHAGRGVLVVRRGAGGRSAAQAGRAVPALVSLSAGATAPARPGAFRLHLMRGGDAPAALGVRAAAVLRARVSAAFRSSPLGRLLSRRFGPCFSELLGRPWVDIRAPGLGTALR